MIDVRMFTVGPVQENCFVLRAKGADLDGGLLQRSISPGHDHDVRSFGGQTERGRLPDALAATGDKGDLARD